MTWKALTKFNQSILLLLLIFAANSSLKAVASQQQQTPLTSTEKETSICPAELPNAIDTITNSPEFRRYRWGILIQTLSTSQTLYSRETQQYFIPASTTKLLTTAAALRQLGADYRIRTSVYGKDGILRVVGRGDPSLTDVQLKDLAQQLKRQGIRQLQQLIVQDDYFQGPILNANWEWEDVQSDYGAPVNSLILNQNILSLTLWPQASGQPLKYRWHNPLAALQWQIENNAVTGSAKSPNSLKIDAVLGKPFWQIRGQLSADSEPEQVDLPVRDPAENFLQNFRFALESEGISIAQAMVSSGKQTINEPELAAVESPPMSQLIADTNQPSNNLYAEALLRTIGATQNDAENQTLLTAEKGLAALKLSLTDLGVDPQSYAIADGSGLSRRNLISPEALVQLLRGMANSPQAEIYRASLPIAGISGTLKNRFKDTPAQGIVQAKTGTMTGVNSLSGYVDTPNYEKLVFSLIANQSDLPARRMRSAIDEIVVLLTRLRRC